MKKTSLSVFLFFFNVTLYLLFAWFGKMITFVYRTFRVSFEDLFERPEPVTFQFPISMINHRISADLSGRSGALKTRIVAKVQKLV